MTIVSAEPRNQMGTPPDLPGVAVNSPRQNRKPTAEALTELASRLEQQGIHARVWVHDGLTVALTHRHGDTEATIEEALREGTEVVRGIAAELAVERSCTRTD